MNHSFIDSSTQSSGVNLLIECAAAAHSSVRIMTPRDVGNVTQLIRLSFMCTYFIPGMV